MSSNVAIRLLMAATGSSGFIPLPGAMDLAVHYRKWCRDTVGARISLYMIGNGASQSVLSQLQMHE